MLLPPRLRHRASPGSKGGRIEVLISPLPARHFHMALLSGGQSPFDARRPHCVPLHSTCEPDCHPSPRVLNPDVVPITTCADGLCSYSSCVRAGPRHSSRALLAARGGSRARWRSPDALAPRRNSPLDPPSGSAPKVAPPAGGAPFMVSLIKAELIPHVLFQSHVFLFCMPAHPSL